MKISYQNLNKFLSVQSLVVLVFSVLLGCGQSHAQVVVEMKLDTADILVGQQVQLSTTVSAGAKQNVKFPAFKQGEEMIKGVEVVSQSDIDTTFIDGNKRYELNRKYNITSFDSAIYNIPAMAVVVDADTFRAKAPVGLKVNIVPVDTTKLDHFAGPHTVVPETFNWRNHLLILSLCTWAIILLLFIVSVKLTRRKPLTTKKVITPQIPPFKQAITAVKSMKVKAFDSKDEVKDYFIGITDALRVYLQRRFDVLALEKTTSEIITAMKDKVADQELEDLKLIFETADFVKFAKFMPSEFEINRCSNAADKFLNSTVDDNMEHPEPIVQIIVLNDGMQKKFRIALWTLWSVLIVGGMVYGYFIGSLVYHTLM